MGEVYTARDTRLERLVAIKVSREQFSKRFDQNHTGRGREDTRLREYGRASADPERDGDVRTAASEG